MYAIAAANADNGDILPMTKEDHDVYIMGVIMTQYSLNKGLKAFGDQGEEAVVKRAQQPQGHGCLSPMDT